MSMLGGWDQDNCDAMSAPGGPRCQWDIIIEITPGAPGQAGVNTSNNETCLSDAHGFHLNMIIIVLTILLTLQASIFSMSVRAGAISPLASAAPCNRVHIRFSFHFWEEAMMKLLRVEQSSADGLPSARVILVTDLMRNGNFATNRGFYLRNILHNYYRRALNPFASSPVSQDQ